MRYFQIAGLTVCLDSELDLHKEKFNPAILQFEVNQPGDEKVFLNQSFSIPKIKIEKLGKLLINKQPWAIYEDKDNGIINYLGILSSQPEGPLWCFAEFNQDYSVGKIYSNPEIITQLSTYGWHSLTLFPSDRFWLAQLLAHRQGLMFHSAGAILNGKGLLFLGRSEAGKTTTTRQLMKAAEDHNLQTTILCDETNIVRYTDNGFWLHGTWSHGEEERVSPTCAPLESIFMLTQGQSNWIEPLTEQNQRMKIILETIYRPLMTQSWWGKQFDVIEKVLKDIPIYIMHFDKSGDIIPIINEMIK